MRRRAKFLLSSLFLSFGLLGTQYIPLEYRVFAIAIFFFVTYAVSAWALFEDLNGIEWLTVVPIPGMYAVSVALFYYLLPENIWSRLAILGVFGLGMYALYLAANIFTVAKARTIQLLRVAHTVELFFFLLIGLFLANTMFSLHWPFWLNGIGVAVVALPIFLISLWSVELKKTIDRSIFLTSLVAAAVLGESALALSFFPASIWMLSLAAVSGLYTLLGLLTTKLAGRLFPNTVWEYLAAWALMMGLFFFTLQWK